MFISPIQIAAPPAAGTPISPPSPKPFARSATTALSPPKPWPVPAVPKRPRKLPWRHFENTSHRISLRKMLRHKLIHPQINENLGPPRHHAKVLIADGNYPAPSKKGPQ